MVSPDGRLAACASDDKTLRVWEMETGESLATFTAEAYLYCCAFAGNEIILAGDCGGYVHFLKLEE